MLSRLSPQAPDKIIGLMQAFRADPRPDKIDLGVGVYRDAAGATPVMRAVKAAEEQLWQSQQTKGYVAIEGDPEFLEAVRGLVLADAVAAERVAAIGTPGGTGAVRIALDLVRLANPAARVFLPDPSWPNHAAIVGHLGLEQVEYRYYDAALRGLDRDGMLADLGGAGPGDVVILHGCCHNPTGADLTAADWADVAAVLERTGALALVDLAYQGFGAGVEADAEGLRMLAARLPEMLVAVSGSKNFGLYRERVGAILAVAGDAATATLARGNLSNLNRQTYAFPPDHGARVVTGILTDAELRADWLAELDAMRTRMEGLRASLADTLREISGSDRFAYLAAQKGMFSLIGATPDQVAVMRDAHGVYVIGDGRMNVAGLSEANIPRVARAMLAAGL
ncbi:amino acid aminotransferase [Rhodovulum strictum]|uniref:Aminotransferase class I/II-fold pyridoxal phosphate-dependent enzyme n=1 Tax=Rhodovulum strictum TaxID=58314 RepID=A0A844BR29_9RHOB|nr:amino acid aminotransferase [Rhodovulum strictum]MRH22397.1 aminotransferase class I/II-fold pyridoxal phosphate-dependent enzyme [Rhodovulum strictum]